MASVPQQPREGSSRPGSSRATAEGAESTLVVVGAESTLVVVDVGCYSHGQYDSLGALVNEYTPDRIYGFDPSADTDESVTEIAGVPAEIRRSAAWLYDGEIGYTADGTRSAVAPGGEPVLCFDLSAWLAALPAGAILKLDVEGAEYELLERLIADGVDAHLGEILVEWHGDDPRAGQLTERLACPVREWWM